MPIVYFFMNKYTARRMVPLFFLHLLAISLLLAVGLAGAQENPGVAQRGNRLAQEPVFDLAVGSVTIDTNTVIPGLQNKNYLEGTFFIYGEASFSPIPVVVNFQISDSNGNVVFTWTESHEILNELPTQLHYQGTYRYDLPEGIVLPLDVYTLTVAVEPDPAQADKYPGGVIPPEIDPGNNANMSVGIRILQLSGNLHIGDIKTVLTAIDFFDTANMQISGASLWNTDIPLTFANLTVARDEATLDLNVVDGSIPFITPTTPYQPEASLWKYQYIEGVLDPTGANASINILLPDGLGYRGAQDNKNTFVDKLFPLGRQKLTQTLQLATAPLPLDVSLLWSYESLGFMIQTDRQTFDSNTGFILENPKPIYRFAPHFNAGYGVGYKASNCGYLQGNLAFSGAVVIKSDGVEASLASDPVTYQTSFPVKAETALQSSAWEIRSGKFQFGTSKAQSAKITQLVNSSGCANVPVTLSADIGAEVNFSEDGALAVDGAVATPVSVDFNTYDFETIGKAVWYQPGFVLPMDSMKNGTDVAEYLQAMRERDKPMLHSYGSPAFRDGTALFAGMNIMPEDIQGKPFQVTIDVSKQDFTATEWTKFYIRPGGFSGIVDAISVGKSFEMYADPDCGGKGYDVKLSAFGQAYLDNNSSGLSSTTKGQVDIPWPSAINLPFEHMVINSCGNFTDSTVPASVKNVVKTLAYWQADFRLMAFGFPLRPGAVTDNQRTCWISSKNKIVHLDGEPAMQTNIRPCGTIRDSRIESALLSRYDGYATTVQKIYLSTYDGSKTPNGFYNLVGDLVVSFFNAPKVHMLVRGAVGEIVSGDPWFNQPDPDVDRDGFPSDLSISATQIDAKFNEYVAKAPLSLKAQFANMINLHYLVGYNKAKKEFASTQPIQHDLIVIDIKSAVDYLNASRANISFGVDIGGIPELNLSSAASQFSGAIQNSFLGPVRDQLDDVSRKLTGDLTTFARPALKGLIQPQVQILLDQLKSQLDGLDPGQYATFIGSAEFQGRLDTLLLNINFSNVLRNPDVMPVVGAISDVLQKLRKVSDVLHYNPSNLTAQLGPLVQSLLSTALSLLGANTGFDLNQVLSPLQQSIDEINRFLDTEVIPTLASAETAFQNPTVYLDQFFKPAAIGAYETSIKATLQANLKALATATPAQVKTMTADQITDTILNELFNSPMFQQLNNTVTTKIFPVKTALTDQAQVFLDAVNGAVTDYIKNNVGNLLQGAASDIKGMSGFKGASMRGYAIISGNTMEKLHIDADFTMSIPDEMKYSAYLDMTRYQTKNSGKTCTAVLDGKDYLDCRIGARGIKLDFPAANLTAGIELKFMLSGGALVNVGGSIETKGYLGFATMQVTDPSFGVSVGQVENYFWASVGIKFDTYTLKGGIFLGTSCDLEPLKKIDPEVASLLSITEMRGIYLSAGGSFPIINFGCPLNVGVSAKIGFWYFANGPTYGGKLVAGAYGEAACVVSIKGQLQLIAGKDPAGYFFKGTGWAGGGIGDCDPEDWDTPEDVLDDDWCASCVAIFDLIYKNDDWDVDYDVDCSL